jgi:hypothetical protein
VLESGASTPSYMSSVINTQLCMSLENKQRIFRVFVLIIYSVVSLFIMDELNILEAATGGTSLFIF